MSDGDIQKQKERWAEEIRLRGRDYVGARKNLGEGTSYQGWLAALKEYDDAQRQKQAAAVREQVAREEEALKISRQANEIAARANSRATWAIVISVAAIVVTAVFEFFR